MLPSLEEIKLKRKQFGLTQAELAEKARVSQSLIAKVESGSLVPGYDNAKKLFDVLDSLRKEKMLKARDVMTERVYSIGPNEPVKKAVMLMEKHGISQLPVMDGDRTVGTITERSVLEKAHKGSEIVDLSRLTVKEIMSDFMPVVGEESDLGVISSLLEYNPGVLVAKNGRIKGIITKSGLLAVIIEKRP